MAKKIVRLVCYESIDDMVGKLFEVEGTPVIIPFPAAQYEQGDFVAIFEVREVEDGKKD